MHWFRKSPAPLRPAPRVGAPAARVELLEQRALFSASVFVGSAYFPADVFATHSTHHAKATHHPKAAHHPRIARVTTARAKATRVQPAVTAAATTGAAGFEFTATRPDAGTTPVSITRFDGSSQPISPSVRTWILIHGYMGNGHTAGLTQIDKVLHAKYPHDQILTLDWSAAAADPTYADTEQWLPVIGAAAAEALAPAGFPPGSLNVIGYSFGTYIADELASHLSGGVNTIAAIDPPEYIADGAGSFDPEVLVNFAAHSDYSWAFHDADAGSSLGDAVTPTTADESIDVTGTSHSAIIGLFGTLIGNTDPVSERFDPGHLLAHGIDPYAANRYDSNGKPTPDGGYEALLTTTSGGTVPVTLSYFSSSTGNLVTLHA